MKLNIPISTSLRPALAGLAVAASVQFASAQTSDLVINNFDDETSSSIGESTRVMWGSSSVSWDATQDNTGNNGGALRIESIWSTASDTPLNVAVSLPTANPWWYGSATVNLSEYSAIEFDLKWDNSSDVNIDQWNNQASWPGGPSGGTAGIDVNALANASGGRQFIMNTNLSASASNGWVRIVAPINPAQANIDPCVGIDIAKWMSSHGSITNPATNYFWIDNVMLRGTAGPPPPPTLTMKKPGPAGVEITMDDDGSQWQRNALVSPDSPGDCLWSGYGSTPVTYSFTIADFPDRVVHEGFEAHLYLVNGDTADSFNQTYGGCDWNVPNIAIVSLLSNTNGGFDCQFQFKTNLPNANPPENATHRPATLQSPTALGTWSLSFTHNTNVMISGPGGISTNFTIPEEAVLNNFSAATSFIQYGFHKNDDENDGHNNRTSATFSRVQKTGGGFVFDDTFDGPTLTNNYPWRRTSTSAVQQVTPDTKWMVSWTTPAIGFSPQSAAGVPGPWGDAGASKTYESGGRIHAAIPGSALPSTDSSYFRLVKRSFTKLQILLPGETAAPGTPTGKTGTPDPQTSGVTFFVTVRAVDDQWNLIPGITHTMTFTASDGGANLIPPADGPLVNGEGQFESFSFAPGTFTLTVSDLTDGAKVPDTSSSFTVN